MGVLNLVICDDCGYEAEVCARPDTGLLASVVTMTCLDCQELVDVATKRHGPEGSHAVAAACPRCHDGRLSPWGMQETVPLHDENGDLRDGVRLGPCPKCGAEIVKAVSIALWD